MNNFELKVNNSNNKLLKSQSLNAKSLADLLYNSNIKCSFYVQKIDNYRIFLNKLELEKNGRKINNAYQIGNLTVYDKNHVSSFLTYDNPIIKNDSLNLVEFLYAFSVDARNESSRLSNPIIKIKKKLFPINDRIVTSGLANNVIMRNIMNEFFLYYVESLSMIYSQIEDNINITKSIELLIKIFINSCDSVLSNCVEEKRSTSVKKENNDSINRLEELKEILVIDELNHLKSKNQLKLDFYNKGENEK